MRHGDTGYAVLRRSQVAATLALAGANRKGLVYNIDCIPLSRYSQAGFEGAPVLPFVYPTCFERYLQLQQNGFQRYFSPSYLGTLCRQMTELV